MQFVNQRLGRDLTPIFDQYLRRAELPTLEVAFDEKAGTVAYRWRADERGFNMPIKVGKSGAWQTIQPTTDWKLLKSDLKRDEFDVATDLFYVDVEIQAPAREVRPIQEPNI